MQRIGLVAAIKYVDAFVAKELIDPVPTREGIIPIPSGQEVVTCAAIQHIIAWHDQIPCFVVTKESVVVRSA